MKVFDRIFGKKYEKRIDSLIEQLRNSYDHCDELSAAIKRLKTELQLQRVLIEALRDVNQSLDERLIEQEGAK